MQDIAYVFITASGTVEIEVKMSACATEEDIVTAFGEAQKDALRAIRGRK